MTEFYVKVQPDSEQFDIKEGSIKQIKLEERAENGRANSELIKRLEKILGKKPGIVSGHKSKRKKLKVDLSEKKVEDKFKEAIKNR